MTTYAAPVSDLIFALYDVLKIDRITDVQGYDTVDRDTGQAILDAMADYAGAILAPTNATGDQIGAKLGAEGVVTPPGFKEAYRAFVDGGWPALIADEEDGGQGLPLVFRVTLEEMLGAANMAFAMSVAGSPGHYQVLLHHGSDLLKRIYIPPIVSGEWATAMSLTEPQCGSALGLVKCRAVPGGDGTYSLTGTKIFNSWGDHDLSPNIVHLVLARLPDAPGGTRGLSLFLVPKYLHDETGMTDRRNSFSVGSLEHKMGIHGSPTCVTNFDGATGYLVGELNQGLANMFVLMNTVRLSAGVMSLGMADSAATKALAYSRERIAGVAPSRDGARKTGGDPIIAHPDVRRMLMSMRAFTEAGRQFALWVGMMIDRSGKATSPEDRKAASALVALLTPVVKAFLSDKAFESIDMSLQCFGGHGYIREHGVEQLLRDERMMRLGEGVSGVQAMDLLHRKVVGDQGKTLTAYLALMRHTTKLPCGPRSAPLADALSTEVDRFETLTRDLSATWAEDAVAMGAASVDYLYMLGNLSMAFMWLMSAQAAEQALGENPTSSFHLNKLATAEFHNAKIMPVQLALAATIKAGAETLMRIPQDAF